MSTKVFIDGSEGTTGLRIYERFQDRNDVEIMKIDPAFRKDPVARKELINASDITFLCLPDPAAIESVSLVENNHVKILDTSTAHRVNPDWAYGIPELSTAHRDAIKTSNRIAVPGCHATGFIMGAYPLVQKGVIASDFPISAFSLTGYSGGGKKMIAQYEVENLPKEFTAPREYALSQQHKHLKEMKYRVGLDREPLFSPIVANYYSGMVVSIPLYTDMLKDVNTPEQIHQLFTDYYSQEQLVKVMPLGSEQETGNMLSGISLSGWDGISIYVTGNDDRVVISTQFDNLGKGSSGAAIQCMNILMGCDEKTGLDL